MTVEERLTALEKKVSGLKGQDQDRTSTIVVGKKDCQMGLFVCDPPAGRPTKETIKIVMRVWPDFEFPEIMELIALVQRNHPYARVRLQME